MICAINWCNDNKHGKLARIASFIIKVNKQIGGKPINLIKPKKGFSEQFCNYTEVKV